MPKYTCNAIVTHSDGRKSQCITDIQATTLSEAFEEFRAWLTATWHTQEWRIVSVWESAG